MRSTVRVSPVTGLRLLRKILNLFILMLDTGLKVTESRLEQLAHVHDMIMNMITGIPTPFFSRFFNS